MGNNLFALPSLLTIQIFLFPSTRALSSPGFGRMVQELAHPVSKKGYSAIALTPACCLASLAPG